MFECDNCHWTGSATELHEIRHRSLRVDEDGPEPDGQCPECGALCYEVVS